MSGKLSKTCKMPEGNSRTTTKISLLQLNKKLRDINVNVLQAVKTFEDSNNAVDPFFFYPFTAFEDVRKFLNPEFTSRGLEKCLLMK